MIGSRRLVTFVATLVIAGGVAAYAAAVRSDGRPAGADLSPIIYPESARVLRAAHDHPAHRRLRCERCHVGATRTDQAGEMGPPPESSCAPCHAQELDRSPPIDDRCATCHIGFEPRADGGVAPVPLARATPPRLHFSHRAHARAGVPCVDCHRGVTREPGRHLPSMWSCHRCHGGASPTAPDECTTCHLSLGDGRMRSVYPEGWLNPPRWLGGMHHDREWIVTHRWVAADQGSDCASCHRESDCADCHDGRVRPDRVHPNDFITLHGEISRRNLTRCTSCHTTQSFCTECHARLGLSTMSAPVVSARTRFHPPPDVWVRGPVMHGRAARRSMNDCVSCHAERDCVQCHGALGVGAGVSPHPPGFAADCRRLLEANVRACRTCHDDVSVLLARCR